MSTKLRVMLIDASAERARDLAHAIERRGDQVVATLVGDTDIHSAIRRIQPDLIIIDIESPDRDTLEDMQRISDEQPRPIVMFVDECDSEAIRVAVQAGVAGYVVKGSSPDRVGPVLEVAMARFQAHQELRNELAKARSTLEDRKCIDRAKGILMDRKGMSENEAYGSLRKLAMDRNLTIADVARRLIQMSEIL